MNEEYFLIGAVIFLFIIILLVLREGNRRQRIAEEEREILKNKENFSVEVKNNTVLTKNTEMVELEIKVPDGYKWILEVVDDVYNHKRRIDSSRFGDNSKIAFKVRKGEDVTFIVTGKGEYGAEIIKIPYSS